MTHENNKDLKEICDDMNKDVDGEIKLDLLLESINVANNLNERQREELHDSLKRISNICLIKTREDIIRESEEDEYYYYNK